ncbi:anti-sigma factor family protein [Phosphitispora fastidiosa]|uniref:anti-sigma factor family protein n=1 Tax=Phosphitispora fastidiosa TaxID=2837202 RepID=UPI001E5CFA98|nr:zf-HC2 domain-containing protein [Phosphitispora fastidiosa]MBU7005611.1 hypothetical protein [Phosphitispora fastidiosa]
MNCHECRYLMFDLIDDKLSEDLRQEMEKHLDECPSCAQSFAKMKAREAAKEKEEKASGLFWYLLMPSGGFKRFFFVGAIFTFILVMALISVQLKGQLFDFF